LRRREITGSIALGGLVLLVALLALRFDLASLLFSNTAPTATIQRATAPNTDSTAAVAATMAPERRPAGDRSAKAETGDRLAKAPADSPAAKAPSSSFDVVRIDPEGSSVFAGRAPANSSVTVLANEKPVASAKANADGQWAAVIDRQFKPGEYQLSLTAKPSESAAALSGQSVNITIAANARPVPPEAPKVAAMPAPAPIPFPYDEAAITAMARKQAAALSDFLRERRLEAATLSGHADERGSDEYNMELSRNRLESVARYLREAGYTGKLVLVPKGKSEPYGGPGRTQLSKESAFQLDRRVELRLGQ
jgi:outer membrane protein OmpA-like peptidoglycan-associated protein